MSKLNYCFLLSFFSVGLFSMEQEKEKLVINQKCCKAAEKQYSKGKNAFSVDKTKPLIAHLVSNSDFLLWEPLILMAYKEFTARDLQWVIQEYSLAQTLSLEEAQELFKLVILAHGEKAQPEKGVHEDVKVAEKEDESKEKEEDVHYTTHITTLLEEVVFPEQVRFWSSGISYIANPTARNRIDSILIDCIEHGYFRAFEQILQAFPSFVTTAHEKGLVKRHEMGDLKNSGWLGNEFDYSTKEYSLIGWVSRHSGKYLWAAQERRENYVNALQIVFRELLKQGSVEKKNITQDVFDIMQQLFQQKDLSKETSLQAALQLIASSEQPEK